MATRGDYSVIQFCPDPARFEAANVGVALLCADGGFIDARISGDNRRPRSFFGKAAFDEARLNVSKHALASQVRRSNFLSREAFTHFCAMRANRLRMTPPQFCRVEGDPAATLDDLFEKIVGEAPAPPKPPNFRHRLAEAFAAAGLLGERVLEDVSVRLPALDEDKRFPFAWKNGTGKLVAPVRFRTRDRDRVRQRASLLAIEGAAVRRVDVPRLGKCELHVIGQFREGDQRNRDIVRSILGTHDVPLFAGEDLAGYVHDVQTEGRVLVGGEALVSVERVGDE